MYYYYTCIYNNYFYISWIGDWWLGRYNSGIILEDFLLFWGQGGFSIHYGCPEHLSEGTDVGGGNIFYFFPLDEFPLWNAINGLARYLSNIEPYVLSTSVPTTSEISLKHFGDGSLDSWVSLITATFSSSTFLTLICSVVQLRIYLWSMGQDSNQNKKFIAFQTSTSPFFWNALMKQWSMKLKID